VVDEVRVVKNRAKGRLYEWFYETEWALKALINDIEMESLGYRRFYSLLEVQCEFANCLEVRLRVEDYTGRDMWYLYERP